jgi:hypothetical protein
MSEDWKLKSLMAFSQEEDVPGYERTDKIIVELVPTNFLTRHPCALGGWTEKVPVLCEVKADGPFEGFRVSENFLRTVDGDVDKALDEAAANLVDRSACMLKRAELMRSLKGRLVLPTYAEWERAVTEWETRCERAELAATESELATLTESGAPADAVIVARVKAALLRDIIAKSEAGEYVYWIRGRAGRFPFNASDRGHWATPEPEDTPEGADVKAEVVSSGHEDGGNVSVRIDIIAPFRLDLPVMCFGAHELARLCRAMDVGQIDELEQLHFRKFTMRIGVDGKIIRWYYPDCGDTPEPENCPDCGDMPKPVKGMSVTGLPWYKQAA